MHTPRRFFALLIALGLAPWAAADEPLAHMVFFTLSESTPANREELVEACHEYLSGHEGTLYFSVGVRNEQLDREVNDQSFDVALHMVFENMAAHDQYQTHPRHLEFIEKNQHLWKAVRVFDSDLTTGLVQPVPEEAAGFAGMIRGRVVGRSGRQVLLEVTEVTEVWQTNRAEQPESLVGKRLAVTSRGVGGGPRRPLARFLRGLEHGQSVQLDVAHRRGQALTLMELTEAQRRQQGE